MNLGPAEILVILVVALVVFGPKRLPEVGRQVGGALREIRKVQDTVRSEIGNVMNDDTSSAHPAMYDREPDADHDAMGALPPVRRLDDPDNGPSGSFS
ncbi:MAG: sec-independent protein translocase protein TatA [Actinomycetota bacterium]|jgi:TatA/E family protein of Tat protein translocase|nr:sec-independent protein translocase protein TatA [Actinomycetota bacterium]